MFISSVSRSKIFQKNICLHKCPLTYEMYLELSSGTEFSSPSFRYIEARYNTCYCDLPPFFKSYFSLSIWNGKWDVKMFICHMKKFGFKPRCNIDISCDIAVPSLLSFLSVLSSFCFVSPDLLCSTNTRNSIDCYILIYQLIICWPECIDFSDRFNVDQ